MARPITAGLRSEPSIGCVSRVLSRATTVPLPVSVTSQRAESTTSSPAACGSNMSTSTSTW